MTTVPARRRRYSAAKFKTMSLEQRAQARLDNLAPAEDQQAWEYDCGCVRARIHQLEAEGALEPENDDGR
jgi:hypothetical protein